MRYEPEAQPKKSVEVFVTYIAPIHYNAVRYFPFTLKNWCNARSCAASHVDGVTPSCVLQHDAFGQLFGSSSSGTCCLVCFL